MKLINRTMMAKTIFSRVNPLYTTRYNNKIHYNWGITAFEFVIWGGKLAVLQSEVFSYGDASAEP